MVETGQGPRKDRNRPRRENLLRTWRRGATRSVRLEPAHEVSLAVDVLTPSGRAVTRSVRPQSPGLNTAILNRLPPSPNLNPLSFARE
jgi:hypothetical protein